MPTRELVIKTSGSACGNWFRDNLKDSNNGLSIIDADTILYLFEEYNRHIVMLIEEKANGDIIRNGQGRTIAAVDKMLRCGAKESGIEYWGFKVLQMENTTPDNSKWIRFSGKIITKEQLKKYLNFQEKP